MKLSQNICPQRSLKVTKVNNCTHVSNKLLGRAKASPISTVHPSDQLPDVFSECFLDKVKLIRDDLDLQTAVTYS